MNDRYLTTVLDQIDEKWERQIINYRDNGGHHPPPQSPHIQCRVKNMIEPRQIPCAELTAEIIELTAGEKRVFHILEFEFMGGLYCHESANPLEKHSNTTDYGVNMTCKVDLWILCDWEKCACHILHWRLPLG